MNKVITTLALGLALVASGAQADDRPNILIIVADDMGYNDLSLMGSEISTPNIDSIGQQGLLMTNFHVTPQCSSTRSELMSGADNHRVGLGQMAEFAKAPNQQGQPGYSGVLNKNVATFAETLHNSGYHTYMTGKWHLGSDKGLLPSDRGFEQTFSLLEGAGRFLSMRSWLKPDELSAYSENGHRITRSPDHYFSTRAFVDKTIAQIDSHYGDGKPFLSYVAFNAPHWPLQAPPKWIEKEKGKYDQGWEALKRERLARMKTLGLIDDSITPYPLTYKQHHKAWNKMTDQEKAVASRSMEVYAALVESMDFHTGRLIDHLKKIGAWDNTVVLFFSDNGPHGGNPNNLFSMMLGKQKGAEAAATYDRSLAAIGSENSFPFQGVWAQASNAYLRHYKGVVAEGGVRTPLLVRLPGGIKGRSDAFASVKDIAPTLLALAHAKQPATRLGLKTQTMTGKNLLPLLQGDTARIYTPDEAFGMELRESNAVIKGDWKILKIDAGPFSTHRWELFDLRKDPGETRDLSASQPDKLAEMITEWKHYVADNGVIIAKWPEKH